MANNRVIGTERAPTRFGAKLLKDLEKVTKTEGMYA